MGQLYDEASLVASNRQIDLVVRETEFEKLSGDIELLRGQRKEAERRMQEIAAESNAARDALKDERKKATDLEMKLEQMVATLTDREEKLDRRERELARLRDQLKGNSSSEDELNRKLIEAEADKIKVEAELMDMTLQMSTLLSGAKGGDIEKAMAKLTRGSRAPRSQADRADAREQETADGSRRLRAVEGRGLERRAARQRAAARTDQRSGGRGGIADGDARGPEFADQQGAGGRAGRDGACHRPARKNHQPGRPRAGPAEGRVRRMTATCS